MAVFDHPDFDAHEQITFISDPQAGLRAIIAIHRTFMGTAGGGCRVFPYPSPGAALTDALRLSRAMSYKLALVDLPAGGAKTVVIVDPSQKSEPLLHALGSAVDRLGGRYIIAEDVGTTPEDMQVIGEKTRFVMGKRSDTSPATGYGVFVGLREAVRRRLDRDLEGLRVAVQGVGSVGWHLCRHLAEAGAHLIVADSEPEAVRRVVETLGAVAVAPSAIFDADAQVFAPCAMGAVIDEETLPRLHCLVVAGGANNPLASAAQADALGRAGILYAPDFVINAGGVIGAAHEAMRGCGDDAEALAATERIAPLLRAVFDKAEAEDISTHEAALRMARAKL